MSSVRFEEELPIEFAVLEILHDLILVAVHEVVTVWDQKHRRGAILKKQEKKKLLSESPTYLRNA